MRILRRFNQHLSLRQVNLLGLAIVFACLALSYSYLKEELSYDRFHEKEGRILRLAVGYDNEPVDGRIYSTFIPGPEQIPGVEQIVKLSKVDTGILTYEGKPRLLNDFYLASANFFQVFSFPLLEGDPDEVLQAKNQAVISERFAKQLFGAESPVGKTITVEARFGQMQLIVSGVFRDMPAASHFHSDMIVCRPENRRDLTYVYLLTREGEDRKALRDKLTDHFKQNKPDSQTHPAVQLMPLRDIHLHSRNLREMEPNGNIHFVYLSVGANALLLIVVLFNLWLNTSLIFSRSRRYYYLLCLNGASARHILREEAALGALLGVLSVGAGGLLSALVASSGYVSLDISPAQYALGALAFTGLVVLISLIPAAVRLSAGRLTGATAQLKPSGTIRTQVKIMLTAQYAVVMLAVMLAFGIGKQMEMIRHTQVGAADSSILVLREQHEVIQQKYELLKAELLKHPEIESVTAAMEPPGGAVRDYIDVWEENSQEKKHVPLFVVGEDFFPFFRIPFAAGQPFAHSSLKRRESESLLMAFFNQGDATDLQEQYVVNRKALPLLGYRSPEEIVGKIFHIEHSAIGYISRGVVCGVSEDFNFTSMHEESIPMFMVQRPLFLHNVMVRFDPARQAQALEVFERVWAALYPDYPPRYDFITEVYDQVFRNEVNAGELAGIFSLLCFLIANLGLIVYMAFIIKARTKEIGIRKVNGARSGEIIRMLNGTFVGLIALAFAIAVPAAWIILQRWLQNFAYKTSLDWWLFAGAGAVVLLLSVLCVSWQSWRAARANPVDAIKTNN